MENHYDGFDRPEWFRAPRIGRAIAGLNALPPIRDCTRLIIGDALTISTRDWRQSVTGDSILMTKLI